MKREHLKLEYHDNQSLICSVCGKVFNSKSVLNLHLKYHNDAQFECQYCPKKFKVKSMLTVRIVSLIIKRIHDTAIARINSWIT